MLNHEQPPRTARTEKRSLLSMNSTMPAKKLTYQARAWSKALVDDDQ
jgi:hypothetical protein